MELRCYGRRTQRQFERHLWYPDLKEGEKRELWFVPHHARNRELQMKLSVGRSKRNKGMWFFTPQAAELRNGLQML